MRHYKYQTELDLKKKTNQARFKKFLIAVDKCAHGDYGDGYSSLEEATPVSISTMAVEATEALRF